MTDDERFLAEFEACRWPLSKWHHREHVKLAYLYLREYSFDDAMSRLRGGIKAHNDSHRIPDSPTTGYHETVTHGWLRLVQLVIREYGVAGNADEFYEEHPELWQAKTLRLFYSRERIMSPNAKSQLCEPDLAPLPVSRNIQLTKGKDRSMVE